MKLPNTLVARIWGPFLLMAAALTLLAGWYVPLQQEKVLLEFQSEELQIIANTFATSISSHGAQNDLQTAYAYFSLIDDRESIAFRAMQFEGDTMVISNLGTLTHSDLQAVSESPLLVTAPFEGGAFRGTVFLKGSDDFVNQELQRLNAPLYGGLFIVLFILVLTYGFLQFRVSRPLRNLKQTAESIRGGDLDRPVDIGPRIQEVRALNLALERLRTGLLEQREMNTLLTKGMEEEIQRQTKDLRKTLDELQDSRNLFGSVIESAMDAVVLADGQSRVLEWNRKAELIFGWSRSEAMGKTLGELIIPHVHRSGHAEGMEKYHATGHGPVLNQAFETQALRKTGELFDIELYITDVQVEGEVIFSSFIRDITEPKRLRSDLDKERTLNTSLLNGLPLMVSLKNQDLQFTFVNDEAARVLGKPKEALLGRHEREVFEEDWVQDSVALDRAGYEGQQVPMRERTFTVDGVDEKYVIGRHQFSIGEEEKVSYLLTYGFNISELKRAQTQLEDALRTKDEFLATVSHEIRTPLHSIIVLAELLNQGERVDEIEEYAGNIHSSSRHLLALVNDILDFSKAEAGRLELDPTPLKVDEFIENVARMDAGQRKESVNFVKDIQGCADIEVNVDGTRLNQVVTNLLSNAFKFTEQGEVKLTVHGRHEDDHFHMDWAVSDTGIGISPEDKTVILEAFTQANSGIARRFGGTGLGLGIVVRILELMGAQLDIDSEVGQGSTFRFSLALPYSEAPSSASSAGDALDELPPLRLLYVEDMLPNQMVMKAMCKPWPIDLSIAGSGKEALNLVQRNAYDLILMDIQMPEMDGIETLQNMKDSGMTIPPTHAFTAHAGQDDRNKFLHLGFSGVLTKPITPAQLEEFFKSQPHVHQDPQ